ncbi:MAG: hypothetical protein CVT73_13510 [Alphaproteobacteria bacterium HGW-Alphaproteobacteria-12]|nr:MAG: hypothetical protein CVT73_13510 [Alphaproteobacteria bacterium HGW-Alphaproteobacteria-12]
MSQTIRRNNFTRFPTAVRAVLAAVGILGLSGCAAPAIGALTIGEVLTIAGISSTVMTGRDLGEHALSALTGKDCRFLEAALREGRSFCEERNSVATKGDFGGLVALFRSDDGDVKETTVAAADLDPLALGFVPVDRRAAHEFSLEIAREASRQEPKETVSFGMMSATFGQSWDYRLDMAPDASPRRLADASSAAEKPVATIGLRPAHSPYTGL